MLKYLLLLNFITLSFQIDNCLETYKICKSCKSGYTLIMPQELYEIKCQKTDTIYFGNETDSCYIYSDSNKNCCKHCKKGYIISQYSYDCKICQQAPEHCKKLENDICTECDYFFKLTEDNKCERTSCYEYENGKCKCYYGFYLFEEKECKKIPIQYCVVWDGKKCTKCNEGTEEDGNGGCKLIEENDDDEDEDKDDDKREDTGVEHCNSVSWSIGEKPECTGCEQNYELNELKTKCNYLCESTEEYCGQCKDNYYSFDGKTCEIIDPSYKESYAKLFNFNLVSFTRILLLLI